MYHRPLVQRIVLPSVHYPPPPPPPAVLEQQQQQQQRAVIRVTHQATNTPTSSVAVEAVSPIYFALGLDHTTTTNSRSKEVSLTRPPPQPHLGLNLAGLDLPTRTPESQEFLPSSGIGFEPADETRVVQAAAGATATRDLQLGSSGVAALAQGRRQGAETVRLPLSFELQQSHQPAVCSVVDSSTSKNAYLSLSSVPSTAGVSTTSSAAIASTVLSGLGSVATATGDAYPVINFGRSSRSGGGGGGFGAGGAGGGVSNGSMRDDASLITPIGSSSQNNSSSSRIAVVDNAINASINSGLAVGDGADSITSDAGLTSTTLFSSGGIFVGDLLPGRRARAEAAGVSPFRLASPPVVTSPTNSRLLAATTRRGGGVSRLVRHIAEPLAKRQKTAEEEVATAAQVVEELPTLLQRTGQWTDAENEPANEVGNVTFERSTAGATVEEAAVSVAVAAAVAAVSADESLQSSVSAVEQEGQDAEAAGVATSPLGVGEGNSLASTKPTTTTATTAPRSKRRWRQPRSSSKRSQHQCLQPGCQSPPTYGSFGDERGSYCAGHGKPRGLENVVTQRCRHRYPGDLACPLWPAFGRETDKSPTYCAQHALSGMKNINNARCRGDGCERWPSFGILGTKTPVFCVAHKLAGMVDVVKPRCRREGGCKHRPSFGWPSDKVPSFCRAHKPDGMIDVANPRCYHEECHRRPSFGIVGKRASHCAEHKLKGMVDVVKPRCRAPGGCQRIAYFKVIGTRGTTRCSQHQEAGMIRQG